ncbi:MAG: hypothetical protein Q9190_003068 [Brigantiaea leucoxantha]
MPPFVSAKTRRSPSLRDWTPAANTFSSRKPGLYNAAEERTSASLQDSKSFLSQLDESSSDTSLSDISSTVFEDVPIQRPSKRRKLDQDGQDESENDDIDWENAMEESGAGPLNTSPPDSLGDLELTLGENAQAGTFTNPHNKKKGPSKVERSVRITTHCMHVQFLLFHNLLRSRYACDADVHKILLSQLPPTIRKEIETWRLASGQQPEVAENSLSTSPRTKKATRGGNKKNHARSQRDWGEPAKRQEIGAINMSNGDPLIRLLKLLAAYWRKRFTITAPSLHRQGYKPPAVLEVEIASYKNGKHDSDKSGERISSLRDFAECARKCQGSRDVGAQLFVALLRALNIETRLVASLQSIGFGWGKIEEAPLKEENQANAFDTKPEIKGKNSNGKRKRNESVQSSHDSDTDASVIDITIPSSSGRPNRSYKSDLPFPTYWAEAISPITSEVYPVDPHILTPAVATNAEHILAFEPRGAKAERARQIIAYVIAYSPDGTAKDVTARYLKRHMWPGRTKGARLPIEKVPVYNSLGKIKYHREFDWFKSVMRSYARTDEMRTSVDDIEEAKDLQRIKPETKEPKRNEETLQGYKTSADFVLERFLRREEAILPGTTPIKMFTTGKGDDTKQEPVFLRKHVQTCRTAESWHKEGRQVKEGEHPMKMVAVRAVTLTRKREVEEAQRRAAGEGSGEKLKQGLYSRDQTQWIIPPPILNGEIPKNAFGNIDCYVPSMVPRGAAHVPLRSTVKICKRLGIDYAEAVTGFEFGNQRAVPVITGVVVAAENEKLVVEEWGRDEEERRIREEAKREKVALGVWKKMLVGLRIVERVRDKYGDVERKEEG